MSSPDTALTVMQAHLAADCPNRATCWAADIHDRYDPPSEPGWSRVCAYCAKANDDIEPCCDECRTDKHAHCPSWPSCTYDWYGRPCDASTARLSLHFEVTDPSLTDQQLNEIAERIVAQADLLNPCLAFDSVGITRA